MKKSLKITFIVPFVKKTGGISVVLEYCKQLSELGHCVKILYPILPYLSIQSSHKPDSPQYWLSLLKNFIVNLRNIQKSINWVSPEFRVTPVLNISNFFIPKGDIIIATAWPTAFDVAKLSSTKGTKVYFIQDYEIWNNKKLEVEETYRLPLKKITIVPWLSETIFHITGNKVDAEILNAIDNKIYTPPDMERNWELPVVLMMYHELKNKGSEIGLRVLSKINKKFPAIKIKMFGFFKLPDGYTFIEYKQNPTQKELVNLYQSATIFLSPSISDGWGLPVVEAMSCGCVVVATKVGCVNIIGTKENLICAEPGAIEDLESKLETAIINPKVCQTISKNAIKTTRSYTWKDAADQLELYLLKISNKS